MTRAFAALPIACKLPGFPMTRLCCIKSGFSNAMAIGLPACRGELLRRELKIRRGGKLEDLVSLREFLQSGAVRFFRGREKAGRRSARRRAYLLASKA